jgi:hypothetical protein
MDHSTTKSVVASLAIKGGAISATGKDGAGMGGGYAAAIESASLGASTVQTLTISGGVIIASAGDGAGIGAGFGYAFDHGDGASSVTTISISNRIDGGICWGVVIDRDVDHRIDRDFR